MRSNDIAGMRRDPRADDRDHHGENHDDEPDQRRNIAQELADDQHWAARPAPSLRAAPVKLTTACFARGATRQSSSAEGQDAARLLRGACPRAARSADPWARNDS